MKRYVRSSSNPEADAYFEIMNLLDDAALRGSRLTTNEKKKLDSLKIAADITDIRDIADANDCYTPDDDLCSTWDEMVIALRGLFESGDRVPVK